MRDSAFVAVLLLLLALLIAGISRCLRSRFQRPVRYRRRKSEPVRPETAPVEIPPEPANGRRKPEWVRNEVLRLKALIGDIGVLKLSQVFNRMHGDTMTVGKSFVYELLKRHAYEIACLRREIHNALPRPCRINAVWALDFSFQTDGNGQTHAMLGLIDHGSRVLLRLKRLTTRNAWTVLGHICLAIGEFGRPRAVRTDNEAVLRSRVLSAGLRTFRIARQFTALHSPWQNGRAERLFGTVKAVLKSLVRKCALPDATALDRALCEFRFFYNHVRPHQNLDGRTPAEVWPAGSASVPLKPVRSPPEFVSLLDGLLVGYYLRR